jgi:hypothetical protein
MLTAMATFLYAFAITLVYEISSVGYEKNAND